MPNFGVPKVAGVLLAGLSIAACSAAPGDPAGSSGPTEQTATTHEDLSIAVGPRSISYEFADLTSPIAGVAGDEDVVFVGEPLDGNVAVLSRLTGQQIASLPQPPGGFAVPFIMHSLGNGRLGILGAGGLPQPAPFVPANPFIYEYSYDYDLFHGFSATLTRTVSFASALIGFSEDFARLPDGRYLLSDSVLGSIWVANADGTIVPGIVPRTFDPQDAIPKLALCPTMPEVTVNGFPFLFSGSTLPGVSPLAVRDGTVYYYSPCARGLYSFPLSILTDSRQPYQRAADIHLVAATPANVQVEELLGFTFNPYNPFDRYLYATDPLALQIIRIDVTTGVRQVVAEGAKLFDFPSSLAFLPPVAGLSPLAVVSNQQERSPLTNDAVATNQFNLPFIVAKVFVTN